MPVESSSHCAWLNRRLPMHCAVGAAVGALLVGGIVGGLTGRLFRTFRRTRHVFVLVVTMKFATLEETDAFIDVWSKMAEYCYKNEPNTLSYELSRHEEDPTKVIIFERYRRKVSHVQLPCPNEVIKLTSRI